MTDVTAIERRFASAAEAAEAAGWATVDGTTVQVSGGADQVEQLRRFYAPYYELREGSVEAPFGEVLIAPSGAEAGAEDEGVTDMRVFLRASEPIVVDARFVRFLRPTTRIEVVFDRRENRVLLNGERPGEVRLQARTLIRDQVFRQLEKRQGSVVFHAAAIELDGVGVAFAGPRDSGKTVSLLAHLAAGGANLISGDRIKLRPDRDGSVAVSGMPARCNIHRVAIERDPFLRPLTERGPLCFDREGKVLVEARRLAALAACEQVASARLGLVVFPQIVPGEESAVVERIDDRDELRRLMRENVMEGSRADRHVHWLGWIPDPQTMVAERAERVLDALVEGVRGIRVRAGYEAYVSAIADRCLDLLGCAGARTG